MSFTLDWSLVNLDGDNMLSDGTADLGVNISTPSNGGHPGQEWFLGNQIEGDKPTVQSSDVSKPTEIVLEFDRPITDLAFELYDVDSGRGWDDKVTILALNADGEEVPVTFGNLEATHMVDGNTIEAEGNASPSVDGPGAPDSVTVKIAGPIVSIRIIHDNGGDNSESGVVGMSDWTFAVAGDPGPERDGIVSGTDGDDVIVVDDYVDVDGDQIDNEDAIIPGDAPNDDRVVAGAGDDYVDALLGDDTVDGGTGDDTLLGGVGEDSLIGGEGNDSLLGGDGDDTIDAGIDDRPDRPFAITGDTGDANPFDDRDTVDGGAGDDVIRTGDDRDSALGGEGDDTIDGGADDDTLDGGTGRDSLIGGEGNDTLFGGAGDDTLIGDSGLADDPREIIDDAAFPAPAPDPDQDNGRDSLVGGDGNDLILGGDDDDTLIGGAGDDTLDGGIDDDRIFGNEGSDSILGGQGDDVIISGPESGDFRPDRGYPPIPGDSDPFNDRDTVDGGLGDDVIQTGDDNDLAFGGEGDDIIDGGFDDDTISGDAGDDTLIGGEGNDTILGGDGDDSIVGGIGLPDDPINIPDDGSGPFGPDLRPDNGRDLLDGGAGDDIILGEDDDDTLLGGEGDDFLDGGIDDDSLEGGAGEDTLLGGQGDDFLDGGDGDDSAEGGIGNDTLTGGAGVDTLSGGDDRDVFRVDGANDGGDGTGRVDQIFGGSGGDDLDTLEIAGERGVDWRVVDTVTDSDGNGLDGRVEFLDGDGNVTGSLEFENIEIVCFTPGTRIATPQGPKAVQELCPGDRVLTRDNGVQEIAWVGQTGLNAADFAARPHLAPILIRKGALGNGLPERDMMVSPQHRVLVASDRAALYFDDREVLVAAKHLVNGTTIVRRPVPQTSYIHFMCERHEVVLSDGAWTESFQPGDYSLNGIDGAQRREIMELFPDLATADGLRGYAAARRTLKRHEAMLLSR